MGLSELINGLQKYLPEFLIYYYSFLKLYNSMIEYNHRPLFYRLGQNGTNKMGQKQAIVTGNGSDLNNSDGLKDRAKRKIIT